MTAFFAVVFVLGIIMLIHECGHYLSARSIGVAVQEFSIGIGPAVWKKQGTYTLFSLRCLPLGGYCLFDPETEGVDRQGRPLSLTSRKAIPKIYVSLAGSALNFVLGAVLFTLLFSAIGISAGYEPVIGVVNEGSTALEAGLIPGDRVIAIDEEVLETWSDISRIVGTKSEGEQLIFRVNREGQELRILVKARYNPETGRSLVGVSADTRYEIIEKTSILRGIELGFRQTFTLIGLLFDSLVQMITGKISVRDNLSGPVELIQVIGKTASGGFTDTLFLTAFLSVNMGMMNLLPIPALDGGKIILYLVEFVRRKPLSLEIESWINAAGIVLLMTMMLLLTVKDLMKAFGGG